MRQAQPSLRCCGGGRVPSTPLTLILGLLVVFLRTRGAEGQSPYQAAAPALRDAPPYTRCKDTARCPRTTAGFTQLPALQQQSPSSGGGGAGGNATLAPAIAYYQQVFRGGWQHPTNLALSFDDWTVGSFGLVATATTQPHPPILTPAVAAASAANAHAHAASLLLSTWSLGDATLSGPLYLNHSCDLVFDTDELTLNVTCAAVPIAVDAASASAACGGVNISQCLSDKQAAALAAAAVSNCTNGSSSSNCTWTGGAPLSSAWLPALAPLGPPQCRNGVVTLNPENAWLAMYAPALPTAEASPGTLYAAAACNSLQSSGVPPSLISASMCGIQNNATGGNSSSGNSSSSASVNSSGPAPLGWYRLPSGLSPARTLATQCGAPIADDANAGSTSHAPSSPPTPAYAWAALHPGFTASFAIGARVLVPAVNSNGRMRGDGPTIAVSAFHFASFYVGQNTRVRAVGHFPLAIVSRTAIVLDTPLVAAPGTLGVSADR